MRRAVEKHGRIPVDEDIWDGFARRLRYVPVALRPRPTATRRLPGAPARTSTPSCGTRGNRLFYLATAPEFFPVIAENLGGAGLADEPDDGERFARLVVEKPFGSDLASARELNARLNLVFRERQVYRIDHYLGKETVQNLLVLRFGNAIFEPIWNRRYIDHVQITVAEDLGVGTRGGYYDQVGRPARHRPEPHDAGPLDRRHGAAGPLREPRGARREGEGAAGHPALRRRRTVRRDAVRGQYGPGWIAGERVPGYREEEGVDPDSTTETFVAMRRRGGQLALGRDALLPAHGQAPAAARHRGGDPVQAGAPPALRLDRGRDPASRTCCCCGSSRTRAPRCASWPRCPGPRSTCASVSMDFAYGASFLRASPEAYERLLLDALLGDSTLFTRWDEVERAWEILDPLIQQWETEPADLHEYEAGTLGPRGRPTTCWSATAASGGACERVAARPGRAGA